MEYLITVHRFNKEIEHHCSIAGNKLNKTGKIIPAWKSGWVNACSWSRMQPAHLHTPQWEFWDHLFHLQNNADLLSGFGDCQPEGVDIWLHIWLRLSDIRTGFGADVSFQQWHLLAKTPSAAIVGNQHRDISSITSAYVGGWKYKFTYTFIPPSETSESRSKACACLWTYTQPSD